VSVVRDAGGYWLWYGVSLWLLASASLLAGAPRWAAAILAALVLILGLVFRSALSKTSCAFAWFFFLLALWTALTALPLPSSLASLLAPRAAELWGQALEPSGALPLSYFPLSLAPSATVVCALNWSGYAILALAAATVARELGLTHLLLSVLGVAVLVALLTLVHALLGLEHLLGLPRLPARGTVGPASVLVNPNNLAGYMNLGTFAALSLLGSRRPGAPRALLAVGGALTVATVISSGSRGGVLALGFGLLAWCVLFAARRFSPARGRQRQAIKQAPFALVLVLAGISIAVLGSNPDLERELFGDDASKLHELGLLATSFDQVDWIGVGRGAFDSVSARLTQEGANFTHEYIENFALSWLLEWGPWVGAAALLGLCFLLAPGRLRVRGHPSAEGAWLSIVVLLLQNVADLGLELPALAGALAVVGGGLEGSRQARGAGPDVPGWGAPAAGRLLTAVTGLLAVLLLWTVLTGPALAAERESARVLAMRAAAQSSNEVERRAAWSAVYGGMKRFPAEPYFPLVGGWLALHRGEDAMAFAAKALSRAPRSARVDLLLIEVLAQRGAVDQALLHVRRAAEADRTLTPTLATRVVRLTTDAKRLARVAPAGVTGARFLLEIGGALPREAPARSRRHLLLAAVERAPKDVRVEAALGWALLGDLRAGGAPCPLEAEQEKCPLAEGTRERVRGLAESIRDVPACDGLRLHAALLAYEGKGPAAVDLLTACPSCAAPANCAKDRVELALEHGDEAERRLALGAFRSGVCDTPTHCADAEQWLANLFERRSQPELALVHAWRAAELDPSIERHLAAGRSARLAGNVERADVALSRARRLGGRDPELESWLLGRRKAGTEALK